MFNNEQETIEVKHAPVEPCGLGIGVFPELEPEPTQEENNENDS